MRCDQVRNCPGCSFLPPGLRPVLCRCRPQGTIKIGAPLALSGGAGGRRQEAAGRLRDVAGAGERGRRHQRRRHQDEGRADPPMTTSPTKSAQRRSPSAHHRRQGGFHAGAVRLRPHQGGRGRRRALRRADHRLRVVRAGAQPGVQVPVRHAVAQHGPVRFDGEHTSRRNAAAQDGSRSWAATTSFRRSTARAIRQPPKHGLDVVYDEFYPVGTLDHTASLTAIKAAKPDWIYVTGYTQDLILARKQMQDLGVEAPIVTMVTGPAYKEFIDGLGALAEGVTSSSWWHQATNYKGDDVWPRPRTSTESSPRRRPIPTTCTRPARPPRRALQNAIERAGSIDKKGARCAGGPTSRRSTARSSSAPTA